MPTKCLIWFCKNYKGFTENVHFFSLTKERHDLWLSAIGRDPSAERLSTANIICSEHFKPDDLIHMGNKCYTKENAIPTLKLRKSELEKSVIEEMDTSAPSRDVCSQSYVSEGPSCSQEVSLMETDTGMQQKELFVSCSDSEGLRGSPKKRRKYLRTFHTYASSPRKLRKKVLEVTTEKKDLRRQLLYANKKIKKLTKKVCDMKEIIKTLRDRKFTSENALVLQNVCDEIPFLLIKRHIDNAKKGKVTRQQFPEKLRNFAVTLQFYNSKAYDYVRNTFNLALPAPSTIRSWMMNVTCEPGFSQFAFDALKQRVIEDKSQDKATICNLVLDEMAIKKQIEYIHGKTWVYVDVGTGVIDETMSCATECLVLMVVSLNSNWKLPIAYFFIKSLTAAEKANIVRTALQMLAEIGVTITSLTFDGPSPHFHMAELLGADIKNISSLRTYFKHPSKDEAVYIVLDAYHMLKLLRNNWATLQKFIDGEGNCIDFQLIQKLHEVQEEELFRFGTRLRSAHLQWQKQKMKVNLAAHTLSASVADALEFLKDDIRHPEFQHADATIKFIRIADRLFDLCNSRNPLGRGCHTALRQANENYWRPILEESIQYLQELKNRDGIPLYMTRNKTPFIGFIITVTSLIKIYETHVKVELSPLKYILTYKLNQVHLELFFCSIRMRNGSNNNPTAYQFFYTFRILLAHINLKNIYGNCTIQDETRILKVPTSKKMIHTEFSVEDVTILKKYISLDEVFENEHDYAIEYVGLDITAENVVAYISGFVVKSVKKKIRCMECSLALESVYDGTVDSNGSPFMLINRKDRGGLIRPSLEVLNICKQVEISIRQMLAVTDNRMPSEKNFVEIFIHKMSMKLNSEDKYFKTLEDHIFNNIPGIQSHLYKLIKLVVEIYSKIRFYSIAKKQTEVARGDIIRKQYSKFILFKHQ